MQVIWSPRSISHLAAILEYFAERNPSAGSRILGRIGDKVGLLQEHPHAGRPGRVPGTRELIVSGTPYIVAYRIRGAAGVIEIAAVVHGARRWPENLN